MSNDPTEINKTFLCFYHDLYCSDYSASALQKQKEFLDLLDFVSLEEDLLAALELDLEAEEFSVAIDSMRGGNPWARWDSH